MEAEEAERVVRTVHEAAARTLDRLEGEMNAALAGNAMEADALRAALNGVTDEFIASVESVLAAWAEMVSLDHVHPHIDLPRSQLALGAFLELTGIATGSKQVNRSHVFALLYLIKGYLDVSVTQLDQPQPDADTASSGTIGARPSAGPGFYGDAQARRFHERAQAYAEAVAGEQRNVTARPEPNSTDADSVPGISGPYDDLREPWYRRLLRGNRSQR
ncbi:hypothetical protein [Streptomyces sp. NPDC090057]|uniref:hypothetical protein n=1 Tax=Streptomyces sp. NPDC090057 TaxID=3365935 RepID=UPI0037F554A5